MAKGKNKKNVFSSITNFINGIKSESKKIIWTSGKKLAKYSITTILFMVFICVFFLGTDLIIALVTYVKELIA